MRTTTTKTDPSTNLWAVYKKVADEHDNDLVSKRIGDLDTSLLFVSTFTFPARPILPSQVFLLCQAGLFLVVTSTFIAQMIPQLQSNPAELTNVPLLRILEQDTSFGGTDPLAPVSNVPTGVIKAQPTRFVSLSVTLSVVPIAVLGKQWIHYYTRATTWGNIIDRGKERQVKLVGLQKWGIARNHGVAACDVAVCSSCFRHRPCRLPLGSEPFRRGSDIGGRFDRSHLLRMHRRGRNDSERLSVPDAHVHSAPEGSTVGKGIHPACSCLVEGLVEAKDHRAPTSIYLLVE